MREFSCVMALGVLIAQAVLAGAQPITNRLTAITNRLEAIRYDNRLVKRHDPFVIGTNTPAFEQYAFDLMVNQANAMREKWKLEIPRPLSESNVRYCAWPYVRGVQGTIGDKRFGWSFSCNLIESFDDAKYSPRSFNTNTAEIHRLARIKSAITAQEAEATARDALEKLGMTLKQLGLIEPPKVERYNVEEPDGNILLLPLFTVQWFEDKESRDKNFAGLTFRISGITGKVVEYFDPSVARPDLTLPRPALPTNYYDWFRVLPPMDEDQKMGYKPLTRKQ